jgi:hypothetical protein
MIAPTDLNGQNPDPTLRPHILNNSWVCPAVEGCTTRAELETIVNNTQASGIFVVVSAGNSGPSCSSVTFPPAIYNASFSIGAIDQSNGLATFSGRGPSTFYEPNVLKPNVSAPGVSVRSSFASDDGSYANLSGTSMAGPHVCGVVALLWSARPKLARDIEATKTILQNSANPDVSLPAQTCGGIPSSQVPNNSFGYGRVDALAAVNYMAPEPQTSFDYDGDRRSDISVFRPSEGTWYEQRSTEGNFAMQWGLSDDRIAPADYDGDGRTDIAVYRPSNGYWYILNSSDGTFVNFAFGVSEDLPTPADYDGDHRADVSVFRPSAGSWYRQNSSDRSFFGRQFGAEGDKPALGDYDGDGKADIALFRPADGAWYWVESSDGSPHGEQFGVSEDLIVPGDYDGDGKTDLAVFRPSDGYWYTRNSNGRVYTAYPFGLSDDIPVPGDFDGDRQSDYSVFRPSEGNWYRINSGDQSFSAYHFGQSGDKPTQAAFRY